ncbi:MAG: Hypothetical protein BHV28_06740 [Candidatus Tokpelaia hoelldobleri]|uniref:Uncharacterized protein n=1 Tax=Candidatus Tokpelaia hoelldobleri TaxID=1902579 RepID=A0A1U9JU40_9HYPH|nr:MAG: Hypothetical protein BHV28_06740 [Candidatus Tokpelaia hoelldoblerii]
MNSGQEMLRSWLADKLAERGHGAQAALSAHLGLRDKTVSRMLKPSPEQGYRLIKANELARMMEFFGEMPPNFNEPLKEDRERLLALFDAASPVEREKMIAFLEALPDGGKKK